MTRCNPTQKRAASLALEVMQQGIGGSYADKGALAATLRQLSRLEEKYVNECGKLSSKN